MFAYVGPAGAKPPFPVFDIYDLPGYQLVAWANAVGFQLAVSQRKQHGARARRVPAHASRQGGGALRSSDTLANVQALRACAALVVACGNGLRRGIIPVSLVAFILLFAYVGVDGFFVVSDFIVSKASVRSGVRAKRVPSTLR